ncbi:DUF1338 domain-containing protein [Vibrio tritonius]|uniref:DUF1338 domain-containing protein n=1 Tax=Vibrio tritonius TaxID=1435069 RepID=UPI000837ABF8|nr:DUF1338 domain-containing protein [Vibrio tritonius]
MRAVQLFDNLWQDYITRLCPSADKVHQLLQENEPLINDHIALRTFRSPQLGLDVLMKPFLAEGYQVGGEYRFAAKKLYARHLQHPDPTLPKVFISELLVDELSIPAQKLIYPLLDSVTKVTNPDFLWQGRPWSLSYTDYQILAAESEYAGWLAAHGYGANHFTVSVNQLSAFDEVKQVNAHLRSHGFAINEAGGEVKGSPDVMLEQSSTLADKVEVSFDDVTAMVPGGFYEFAKRYPMADGTLYQGFVEASADKIFESTHRQ